MVNSLLVLSLLVASALATAYKQPKIDPSDSWQIVGGNPAKDGAHPHQVSLRRNGKHWCGGSIVHKEWVITAAHCVYRSAPGSIKVVAGSTSLSQGGDSYNVLEVHSHENFRPGNDVAILKVEPITFNDNVAPIAVETEDVGGDEPCVLSGWGKTSYPGSIPDKLQEIKLKTTTLEYCRSRLGDGVLKSDICTLTKKGEGACGGDSGGPLTREVDGIRRLIGIVSRGRPCAVGYPDVFSKASSFISWFQEKCNCLN